MAAALGKANALNAQLLKPKKYATTTKLPARPQEMKSRRSQETESLKNCRQTQLSWRVAPFTANWNALQNEFGKRCLRWESVKSPQVETAASFLWLSAVQPSSILESANNRILVQVSRLALLAIHITRASISSNDITKNSR